MSVVQCKQGKYFLFTLGCFEGFLLPNIEWRKGEKKTEREGGSKDFSDFPIRSLHLSQKDSKSFCNLATFIGLSFIEREDPASLREFVKSA